MSVLTRLAVITRCSAAHENGFEALLIFAVSVLAAKVTQVPTARANICAAVFVAARCFYNYFYITGTNQTKAVLRSLTWFVGMGGE